LTDVSHPLDIESLSRRYATGAEHPLPLLESLRAAIQARGADGVWIAVVSPDALRAAVQRLEARRAAGEPLPLYGVPFGVKDNIDVVGFPTTAACPAFAYAPAVSAAVVQRLVDAGAVVMGKTNMDQFATGLVGVRSPFGVPRNPFSPEHISGGSSSGSAVAVALGQVSFALGTDTAGSGRVPAAYNNIVGLKPSKGVLSTRGLVPACRSLDCVSVFAATCEDAARIAAQMQSFDGADPYARPDGPSVGFAVIGTGGPGPFRFGVLAPGARDFLGDTEAARAYDRALARLTTLGGTRVEIDFTPFREVGAMLYEGPFVAERLEAAGALFERQPEALLSVLRVILEGAASHGARAAYAAEAALRLARRRVDALWGQVDCLALPTAPTHPKIAEVEREPLRLNSALGLYTTFVNLLDLAALAVPIGFRADGLPTGLTLMGPWGADGALATIGSALHRVTSSRIGATDWPIPRASVAATAPGPARVAPAPAGPARLPLAVVGAHLAGEPLNSELTGVGGILQLATRTAPRYRLFTLPGTVPPKPGLVRAADGSGDGAAIEVEVWSLPVAAFAEFVARIPAPLGVGKVELEDGSRVTGFLAEGFAVAAPGARDISAFGGWRAFRKSQS
jgi:allophanate hydrolase